MKKQLFSKALCLLLTLCTLLTGLGFTAAAADKEPEFKHKDNSNGIYTTLEEMKALVGTSSYADYIYGYQNLLETQTGKQPIVVDVVASMQTGNGTVVADEPLCSTTVNSQNFGADKAATSVYLPSTGSTTWEITVTKEQEGLYYFLWDYYTCNTAESSISAIERKLKIGDKVPFDEAGSLTFSKFWAYNNVSTEVTENCGEPDGYTVDYPREKGDDGFYKKVVTEIKNGTKTVTTYLISQDINGNSMSPEAVQNAQWSTYYCQDTSGYEQGYFLFFVSEGQYKITLEAEREPIIIGGLTLVPYDKTDEAIGTYADYIAKHADKSAPKKGSIINIQAEFPDAISDASVAPSNDNTSAATFPVISKAQLYNVIGETSYNTVGQWSAYKFQVTESGLYNLSMRYLQDALEGMYICRAIKLTGGEYGPIPAVPFAEAYDAQFNYSKEWQSTYVGDSNGDAFDFYFEKGVEYTLYLECSLGTLKELIQRVETSLNIVNDCYLRILQLTGATPDETRDYRFNFVMKDVLVAFLDQALELVAIKDELEDLCGTTGSHVATLETVAILLDTMGRDNGEEIARNMSTLKSYLGTLGTWINNSKQSSMTVDSINVVPKGAEDGLEKAEAGFFKSIGFEIASFIYSFFTDYDAMGLTVVPDEDTVTIDVWLATGRDQSQIWRTMIDASDGYTNTTGTAATLKLVTGGTLLPSILSGKGPDVYIGLGSADVINYAIRDAVMGISGNVTKDEKADTYNHFFDRTYYTYYENGEYINTDVEDPTKVPTYVSKSYNEWVIPEVSFSQAAIDTVTLLDVAYGVPQIMSFAMMFYRMDVLANLGQSIPESWSELLSILPVLQTNNMAMGVAYISALDFMIYQMGGSMWKYTDTSLYDSQWAGAKVDLDSDIALEAFDFTCRLYSDYSFPISYDAANRFRTGEMPIVIGDYASIYNTLVVYATEIDGLWEFSSLPGSENKYEEDNFNYDSLAGVSATVMLHGCDNPLAAWQFIQWQTSAKVQADYGNRMVALIGPSAKYETANLEALDNLSWTASEKEAIWDQMSNLSSIVNYPGSYIISRYLKFAFLDAVNEGADATDALRGYIDAINSEIERKREEFDLPTVGTGDAPMKTQQSN